jgi:hypothetical protein
LSINNPTYFSTTTVRWDLLKLFAVLCKGNRIKISEELTFGANMFTLGIG